MDFFGWWARNGIPCGGLGFLLFVLSNEKGWGKFIYLRWDGLGWLVSCAYIY